MVQFTINGGKKKYNSVARAMRAANRANMRGLDVEILDKDGNPILEVDTDDVDLLAYNDSFGETEDFSDMLPRRKLAFD